MRWDRVGLSGPRSFPLGRSGARATHSQDLLYCMDIHLWYIVLISIFFILESRIASTRIAFAPGHLTG